MKHDTPAGDPVTPRQLPSVERVAADPRLTDLHVQPVFLRNAVRQRIAVARDVIMAGKSVAEDDLSEGIVQDIVAAFAPVDTHVINATGVLIHTNLGRVPVSDATARAMANAAASTVTLEVDPETGQRGDRQRRVSGLLRALTGCEAALVVNNNAGGMLLMIAALAAGRDAIVSRGEAVEIGGGFRIPDVLRQGGARLVEVGTTNRTYGSDYRDACGETTGLLLKVHPSNFVITGYTHETTVRELAEIGAAHGVPVVEDQGSGLLNSLDLGTVELGRSIQECLSDGADIVTASGDKLLGGPQSGIILGRADLVARIARHPIARAVRVDKVTLAGLEATLRHYLVGEETTAIPLWQMATTPIEALHCRAQAIIAGLNVAGSATVDVISTTATFGGGAAPGQVLPSVSIRVRPPENIPVDRFAIHLRLARPAVWSRVEDGCLLLDLRSTVPDDAAGLAEALKAAITLTRSE